MKTIKKGNTTLRMVKIVQADYCIPRHLTLEYIASHYEAIRFSEDEMFNTSDELKRDIERVVRMNSNF